MNTIMKNGILALLLVFATILSVSAQIKPSKKKTTTEQPTNMQNTDTDTIPKKKVSSKKTDQYFDETGGFKHRLWYGSSFNLGLSGANGSSLFSLGLTPMVGYKIIGGLSAGPRIGITYTSYKSSDTKNEISTVGLIDYSLGAFTRYKAFKNFFAQAEYEYQSQQFAGGDNYGRIQLDAAGKPLKSRISRTNYYGGIGYNSGGLFAYEIMALYNFNLPSNTLERALSFRAGFTYNF